MVELNDIGCVMPLGIERLYYNARSGISTEVEDQPNRSEPQ